MTRIFVSGCYDILHAGHIEFFKQARALGDSLTVCFAGDDVYRAWKGREPALFEDSRRVILEELRCVDTVMMSTTPPECVPIFMDFARYMKPSDVLVVTDDDAFVDHKMKWCASARRSIAILPKTTRFTKISTTEIRKRLLL